MIGIWDYVGGRREFGSRVISMAFHKSLWSQLLATWRIHFVGCSLHKFLLWDTYLSLIHMLWCWFYWKAASRQRHRSYLWVEKQVQMHRENGGYRPTSHSLGWIPGGQGLKRDDWGEAQDEWRTLLLWPSPLPGKEVLELLSHTQNCDVTKH